MRRTKDTLIDGKPLLQLPEKKVEVLEEDFDEDERILYTASECRTSLCQAVSLTSMPLRSRAEGSSPIQPIFEGGQCLEEHATCPHHDSATATIVRPRDLAGTKGR
jgi:hypothetical protein